MSSTTFSCREWKDREEKREIVSSDVRLLVRQNCIIDCYTYYYTSKFNDSLGWWSMHRETDYLRQYLPGANSCSSFPGMQ